MKVTVPHHASVQYGDYYGTIAADNADQGMLLPWLAERASVPDTHSPIGFDISFGEHPEEGIACVYVFAVAGVLQLKDLPASIHADVFTADDVPITEILKRLKRLNIVGACGIVKAKQITVTADLP